MRTNIILATLLMALLSGCAGNLLKPIPLVDDDRSKIRESGAITVTMQETPGFLFNTPAGALVDGTIGIWVNVEGGPNWANITKYHGVPDFTETIRNNFIAGLQEEDSAYRFVDADEREPFGYKEDTTYTSKYDTQYILEFRTQNGTFHYGTLSWKTYSMNYYGQARIIRAADQQVVWKANCSIAASENPVLKVPADDFLKEDGKDFKAAASYVTNTCAKQLLDDFVGRGVTEGGA